MDTIVAYLDTMFSRYPSTPRLDAAKAELRAMMEDKHAELLAAGHSENEAIGQVITEFGNLDELAAVLGIAAEIHGSTASMSGSTTPGNAAPQPTTNSGLASAPELAPSSAPTPLHPPVTLEEAQDFAEAQRRTQPRLTIAVALFVLSPIPLIALNALQRNPSSPLHEDAGSLIGLPLLLVIVVIGVALTLSRARDLAPFERLTSRNFTQDPTVTAWAKQLRESAEGRRTTSLTISVSLWILAAIPTVVGGILSNGDSDWAPQASGWGVCLTLAIVAIGLAVYLPSSWASSVCEVLTGETHATGHGRSTTRSADEDSIVSTIAGIYWPLLVAIYLGWSFLGNAWGTSWIIWPVGGLAFGVIAAGVGSVEQHRRRRQS